MNECFTGIEERLNRHPTLKARMETVVGKLPEKMIAVYIEQEKASPEDAFKVSDE